MPSAARGAVGVEAEDGRALEQPEHGSSRSVPAPCRASVTEPHSARVGDRLAVAAVVAASRPERRCTTSETSHRGHPHEWPHARQDRNGAQPRRLSSTIALPPSCRSSASASRVPGCMGPGAPARGAHVEHLDRWEREPVDPSRELRRSRPLQLSGRGWRCPPPAPPRPQPHGGGRHGARRSAIALLLVRGVVLLVDDDQRRVGERREDRRARPNAHTGLARSQTPPLVVALRRRQPRVQDGDLVAEARGSAPPTAG